MRRALLLAVVQLGAAGCMGSDVERTASPPEPAPKTVLGVMWSGQVGTLRRLDALTLEPVGRPGVKLRAGAHAFSPDGRVLAMATGSGAGGVRFVDTRTLRPVGRPVALGGYVWAGDLFWTSRSRLLAVASSDGFRVMLVDAAARKMIRSERVGGTLMSYGTGASRLAAVLAPSHGIGQARLAVADSEGTVRTVALPQIKAGTEPIESEHDSAAIHELRPGVAVSPDGRRALVVPPGDRVAEVDLDTMRVTQRDLSEPVSLLGRLRNWLEPPASAKVLEGSSREARWLGEDFVAVAGMDIHGITNGDWDADAAGLNVIDTRDWSVRTLSEHASGLVSAGELVLGVGGWWPEGSPGAGLVAVGTDGREAFRALGDAAAGWADVSWPYAYVLSSANDPPRFHVVDLRTGRVLPEANPGRPVTLLGRSR